MSEWISVKDRHPEKGETVKVLTKDPENIRTATYYHKDCRDGFMESMGYEWVFEDHGKNFARITHWMALDA